MSMTRPLVMAVSWLSQISVICSDIFKFFWGRSLGLRENLGGSNFVFQCIFMTKIFLVFWGGTWGTSLPQCASMLCTRPPKKIIYWNSWKIPEDPGGVQSFSSPSANSFRIWSAFSLSAFRTSWTLSRWRSSPSSSTKSSVDFFHCEFDKWRSSDNNRTWIMEHAIKLSHRNEISNIKWMQKHSICTAWAAWKFSFVLHQVITFIS